MKQILQRLDTGEISLLDVPVPSASGVRLVVQTQASLISAGTERMLLEFGRSGWLAKARSQPDKVREVFQKIRTDGVIATVDAVQSKLATPIALGYCSAGVVVDAGDDVSRFKVGDRVVTNGSHAEFVTVPHTLAAKIPEGVPFEHAAFTPVAAIGLQGIRLAQPTLGETVVVYGLGLIGLLTVQLLRACGCRVIGIDRQPVRLALAERFGAIPIDGTKGDVVARVLSLTNDIGADAVLLALASDSDEPMAEAARMSRHRGRLVLVGVTGLALSRAEFFKKELTFQVSCSYGPGRYDSQYEDEGIDYPIGFVRWTEQRNFEAILAAMAGGQLDPAPLITHRYALEDANRAYGSVTDDAGAIGVVLTYPALQSEAQQEGGTRWRVERSSVRASGVAAIAVIGAGNFALRTLLPSLQRAGARMRTVASSSGTSAAIAGRQFDFERVTTRLDDVWEDPEVDAVFILTRHDSHARLATRALLAGKHAFVEKPLALTHTALDEVVAAATGAQSLLMVGFNRRFAPLAQEAREALVSRSGPAALVLTVNAGAIPAAHWTQNVAVGGGRIAGEACHFVDLARFLIGSPIVGAQATACRSADGRPLDDIATMTLSFEDGSIATVHYLANGSKAFPKERIECFFDGRTLVIDNWRKLGGYGIKTRRRGLALRQDKGHDAEIVAWLASVRDGARAPIALEELVEVSRWTLDIADAARSSERGRLSAPRA